MRGRHAAQANVTGPIKHNGTPKELFFTGEENAASYFKSGNEVRRFSHPVRHADGIKLKLNP
jgi:hypothetical protein